MGQKSVKRGAWIELSSFGEIKLLRVAQDVTGDFAAELELVEKPRNTA